jgi:branched-subunit amino acid transport protein
MSGIAALVDLALFLVFTGSGLGPVLASFLAFVPAAVLIYLSGISVVFSHKVRWGARAEIIMYGLAACIAFMLDLLITGAFLVYGLSPGWAKLGGFVLVLASFFPVLRYFIFPEQASGPWRPQEQRSSCFVVENDTGLTKEAGETKELRTGPA